MSLEANGIPARVPFSHRLGLTIFSLTLLFSFRVFAQDPERGRGPSDPPPPPPPVEEEDEPAPVEEPTSTSTSCSGSAALTASHVDALLRAAAEALSSPRLSAAVVDRSGTVLGLYRRAGAPPELEDEAVGLARTGAFFSNNQAPLSSRTVRFVSGIHFPPGVPNTPSAALYGIENTNRGCDLNVSWIPGQELPRALSVVTAGRCDASDQTGCGTGPVTGKKDVFDSDPRSVHPGGIPVYLGGELVGGLGVAGPGPLNAEFAAFAAIFNATDLSPIPTDLAPPQVVFIDGIRLPFVDQTLPPTRPDGTSPGVFDPTDVIIAPIAGGCAPEGWLVGPMDGNGLTRAEVERLVQQSREVAARTRAVIRLPIGERARMVIAVGDLDGKILGLFRMPDATVFSVDVAVAKARNVVYFSDPAAGGHLDLPGLPAGTAVTNRTISFGAQPLFPPGIDRLGEPAEEGPFFQLFQDDVARPCSQGSQPTTNPNQNGIVFFPGAIPLYQAGQIVGGLGISGDGVEQDDYVSFVGAEGFRPSRDLWSDQVKIDGVRMPFLKFPRNPER